MNDRSREQQQLQRPALRHGDPRLVVSLSREAQREQDRRLREAVEKRLIALRKRVGVRGEDALSVESPEFWVFGQWVAEVEESARSQREIGNLTANDGAGAERCDQMTGCQQKLANIVNLLRRIRHAMAEDGDVEWKLVKVSGKKLDMGG